MLAAVAQRAQFVERQKRRARKIRLHAQHAIEFDGMSDRFMNLQPELRAVENDVEAPFRTLLGLMQRNGLFRDAARVFAPASTLRSVHILCSATVRHKNSDTTASEFRFRQTHRPRIPRPSEYLV